MPTTRSRKQQSQLGFTPLPDSSPTKASQPTATRNRAAAVTFLDSPRPRKRARITDALLPTPDGSSQAAEKSPSSFRHTRSARSGNAESKSSPAKVFARSASSRIQSSPFKKLLQTYDDSESEEEAEEVKTSSKRTRNSSGREKPVTISSSNEESDDALEDEPTISVTRTKTGAVDFDDSESDVDARTPRRRRRRRRLPTTIEHTTESPDDDDEPATPSRQQKISRQEQRDLEDDVEDLRSSSPPPAIKPSQSSARKNALDIYRKNREKQQRGQAMRGPRAISDDDDLSDEVDDAYPDAEQQEEGYYDGNENDDFIESDSEDQDGASALPLELRLQSSKPSELFPHVVEWMVHKRLNPGFRMEDTVYQLAFRKLDDFANGMVGSKFQSSVWRGPFLRALRCRPTLEEHRFVDHGLQHDACDACNRSNHPATFEVAFKGSPYSRETFEDLSDDDEDATRDDEVPPEERVFYLGKFCAANARAAHALRHWQRHLYEWVVDYLDSIGALTPEAIVKRDKMKTSKRTETVNEIVDHMRDTGQIKELHQTFKAEIETAQNQRVSQMPNETDPASAN